MRAALLQEPGRLVSGEFPEPRDPRPGEALVAVRRVGICGTDFHAYSGTQNFFAYPRILGHELAVEVLALGVPTEMVDEPVRVGDLCAVMPYLSCRTCPACRRGRENSCERIEVLGVTIDGGLCERMVVPRSALHSRPGLSLDQLALVETLGIGMHAVERSQPDQSDSVLVIGAGPIGLAIGQCLSERVESVVLSDLSTERLTFAEQTLKVDTVPADESLKSRLLELAGGDLPTLVFDATGSKASMERAFELVGTGGKLILVGHTTGSLTFANPRFHRRELDVRASRNAIASEWSTVLDMVADSTLDAVPWISHRATLSSVSSELHELSTNRGSLVKAIVDIEESH
jgi:threonine dehydrogenase-like Zn-dependent dehydrogenase